MPLSTNPIQTAGDAQEFLKKANSDKFEQWRIESAKHHPVLIQELHRWLTALRHAIYSADRATDPLPLAESFAERIRSTIDYVNHDETKRIAALVTPHVEESSAPSAEPVEHEFEPAYSTSSAYSL